MPTINSNSADLADLANDYARILVQRRTSSGAEHFRSNPERAVDSHQGTSSTDRAVSRPIFVGTRPTASVGLLSGTSDKDATEPRPIIEVSNWAADPKPITPSPKQSPTSQNESSNSAGRLFRWYRSHTTHGLNPTDFFGIVRIEFDGVNHQRLQDWVDAVLTAIGAEPDPIPGLIAAHFLTSLDGTGVINLANWVSESDYDRALATGPDGIAQTDLPEWQTVRHSPGVVLNTVDRCQLISSQFPTSP